VPSTFARLRENLRINQLDAKVDARNLGLGAKPDTIYFTADQDTVNHALADGEGSTNSIAAPVLPMDTVVRLSQPTLMKIDVEGFETPVLQGAQQTLANPLLHSIIIELNGAGAHYGFDEQKIVAMLNDFGFQGYSYDPLTRALIALHGKNLSTGNTLFIRDLSFVQQRLATAPKVALYGLQF
jgi:FkbM family methyltransferase